MIPCYKGTPTNIPDDVIFKTVRCIRNCYMSLFCMIPEEAPLRFFGLSLTILEMRRLKFVSKYVLKVICVCAKFDLDVECNGNLLHVLDFHTECGHFGDNLMKIRYFIFQMTQFRYEKK